MDELDRLVLDYGNSMDGYAFDLRLDLSGLILKRLHSLNKTQRELAEEANMKESSLSRLLHNRANWTSGLAAKLLFILGLKPKLIGSTPLASSSPVLKFPKMEITNGAATKSTVTSSTDRDEAWLGGDSAQSGWQDSGIAIQA